MSELKVIDVDKMADVRSLSGQFYLKSEADKVIADLEESHKMEVEQLLMEIVELKKEIEADLFNEEFYEALSAYQQGRLEDSLQELAQCGAVILRIMETIEKEIKK